MSTETQQRLAALGALAAEVAAALGEEWVVDPERIYEAEVTIRNSHRGERIQMSWETWKAGPAGRRLTIHGLLPVGLHEHGERRDGNPSIGVSATRPPEVIAREITRRIMPGYRHAIVQARLRQVAEQADRRVRDALAGRIAAAIGGGVKPILTPRHQAVVRRDGAEVDARFEVSRDGGGGVEVSMSVTPEVAVRVAELVGGLVPSDGLTDAERVFIRETLDLAYGRVTPARMAAATREYLAGLAGSRD